MNPELNKSILSSLKEAQEKHGYITSEIINDVAESLEVAPGDVYGVATFYSFLSVEPLGEHVITVCKSIPCWMKNSEVIVETIEQELDIKVGETTKDGKFSLMLTNCIGACDNAPAMMIDGQVYDELTSEKVSDILNQLK